MPGAKKIRLARVLRQRETEVERRLWQALRNRHVFGLKFRRQHPIGPFVADFVCIEARLVVEIDGYWHAKRLEQDERRTAYLQSRNFEVVRFNIESETANVEALAETIAFEARARIGR